MASTDLGEFLRHIELFQQADDIVVDQLAESVRVVGLSAGEVLFEQGDPAGFLFVVRRGSLDVVKRVAERGKVRLRRMGPGEAGGLTSVVVAKDVPGKDPHLYFWAWESAGGWGFRERCSQDPGIGPPPPENAAKPAPEESS